MKPVYISLYLLLLLFTVTVRGDDFDWWKTATFYQIYPRSFKDSTGDGIGDINGIREKVDYIKQLGVTAVWLSPIYKSPQKDFGYDVSDYKQVDSIYGTNQDLMGLIAELKARGLKMIMDFVPNHTSDEHEWFIKSVNGDPEYKDFYVWRDKKGTGPNGEPLPPNNWQSVFSGSAWKWNDQRQQFYLHDFVEGQPDVNYENPAVIEAMINELIFWMRQGVDGFRVDALPFMFEDEQFRDEPMHDPNKGLSYNNLNHIYTQNLPKTYELLRNWSYVFDSISKSENKSRIMFLEAYANLEQTVRYYVGPEFAMPFNFIMFNVLDQNKNAVDFANTINSWLSSIPRGAVSNWVVGNHDNKRIATRMGVEFADAMNIMLSLMPGIMVTYNGEELAMEDTFIRWEQAVDPRGLLLGKDNYVWDTRDPERTPMQWDASGNAGFTSACKPWLPVNPNYWRLNVQEQQAANKSHLKVYQQLMAARQTPTLKLGNFEMHTPNNDTLIIERLLNGNDAYVGIISFSSYSTVPDLSVLKTTANMFEIYTASVHSGLTYGLNAETQKNADKSHLKVYKQVMAAKKTPTLKYGSFDMVVVNSSIMVLER